MLSEKKLIISTTSFKGTLAEQCRRILDRTDPDRIVLSLVFFFDVESACSYDSAMSAITGECRRFFGLRMPMVTCVAQKPLESALSAEVLYLHGNGTVEFNDDYLVIRSGDTSELITKGIQFPGSGDTGEQATRVFARIGEILDGEGFRTGDIVRQWNYIESITGMTGGMQNYQMFNDARSAFYSGTDWTNGYPAATGIGSSAGGVVVSIYAVSGPVKVSRPVDNPIQVPAHRYSGRVLVQGRDAVRTTPKFERARLLDDTVLISGTAAIKGENSDISRYGTDFRYSRDQGRKQRHLIRSRSPGRGGDRCRGASCLAREHLPGLQEVQVRSLEDIHKARGGCRCDHKHRQGPLERRPHAFPHRGHLPAGASARD